MSKLETNKETLITNKSNFVSDIFQILKYLDLIYFLVKRNFVVFYKQTVLGPLWYIIQPVLYSLVFNFVFGSIAGIPTNGVPGFLFYLSGSVAWSFFSSSFQEISNTFMSNASLFGKVYFPRIVMPISVCITSLFQFFVQFLIFLFFLIYFVFIGFEVKININLIFLPFIILQISAIAIGVGLIISSITARYRDLSIALPFLTQIWMFITPIVYPLNQVPEKFQFLIKLNPMTMPIENFRNIFFYYEKISFLDNILSIFITIFILLIGIYFFSKVEKNFMDTV